MKINRVIIKNFRCFENCDIRLGQPYHALVGENGSGKTAVLEAISLATTDQYVGSRIDEEDFNSLDKGDLDIKVGFDEFFAVKVPDGYTTQNILCNGVCLRAHRRKQSAAGKALSEPFVIEHFAIPTPYAEGQRAGTHQVGGSRLTIPLSVEKTEEGYKATRKSGHEFTFSWQSLSLRNELVNFPDVFYFDRTRERQAKVGFNSLLQKIAKELNWRYRHKWNQENITARWQEFYEEVIKTIDDKGSGRFFDPVKKKLGDITGVNFDNLELSLLETEQPFSKLFIARRDGTNQISLDKLGSGISVLLAFFLSETVSQLSKDEVILLLDEPELHLHPQLQMKVLELFKTSAPQTIYTTHSERMIDLSDWRSITRFDTNFSIAPSKPDLDIELEGKPISEHLEEIKQWHQHHSIYLKENNELFFARKCLLVEGVAEKYGLPLLSAKLNQAFQDITIISCEGKTKIPYYQLLCRAFHIPFFTMFDLDGETAEDDTNKRLKDFTEQKDDTVMFSTSFEQLLNLGTNHSLSNVMTKIESLQNENLPQEIISAIEKISLWSRK